ncbi:GNAT family N-acetyltransferase [Altererythrobacter arenosus]|uniref:GNAT family N-acetyltransferase n=1 Tax=Altererythrobacter arenosus TaxID=3032592 RepID=A0ABY8FUZ6_9SPHN|nr:GNAT family N-acetyltransferase [Altererythrobacter sp. CAU 1644]WFL78818.1 GNAT family N-acetyltransferase [Altererythrobacter sp. CAU 1644]
MLTIRPAGPADAASIAELMGLAIAELQKGFLTPEQIESSRAGMGLDLQLIDDGTYFCVEEDGALVGCGGWSRRATLYGGNHSAGRDPRLLDPATERARIRAMYTHPDHTRKGIGRLILETAENAARNEGFRELEMAATMSGKPLYRACGYEVESEWFDQNGAVPVPLATMWKRIG